MPRKRFLSVLAMGAVLSVLPAPAATFTNHFGLYYFNPRGRTIDVGDTVVWVNDGGMHTVSGTGSEPFCGSAFVAVSCSVTFTNVGTFSYICYVPGHASLGMTGSITVQPATNHAPSVSISNPAAGAVLAAPADVLIEAAAADTDGGVAQVEFFSDAVSLGVDTGAPYGVAATNLAAGSYNLLAVATDNLGATATNSVSITVVTPVALSIASANFGNDQFKLAVAANAGLRYVFERATDLTLRNWVPLVTNTAGNSAITFTDAIPQNVQGFYRVGRLANP